MRVKDDGLLVIDEEDSLPLVAIPSAISFGEMVVLSLRLLFLSSLSQSRVCQCAAREGDQNG